MGPQLPWSLWNNAGQVINQTKWHFSHVKYHSVENSFWSKSSLRFFFPNILDWKFWNQIRYLFSDWNVYLWIKKNNINIFIQTSPSLLFTSYLCQVSNQMDKPWMFPCYSYLQLSLSPLPFLCSCIQFSNLSWLWKTERKSEIVWVCYHIPWNTEKMVKKWQRWRIHKKRWYFIN